MDRPTPSEFSESPDASTFVPPDGGMFEQYRAFHKYALNRYGTNTIVLYHEGAFFETMSLRLPDGSYDCADLDRLFSILGYEIHNRPDNSGAWAVGVPITRLDESIDKLLAPEDETTRPYGVVVIVSQVGDHPNAKKGKIRRITDVITLGTRVPDDNVSDMKYITQIYIEEVTSRTIKSTYAPYYISVASISVTTGNTQVMELQCYGSPGSQQDKHIALDTIAAYLRTRPSSEVLVSTKGVTDLNGYTSRLRLTNPVYRPPINKEYYELAYQRQFLSKAYPNGSNGTLSVHQWLHIDQKPAAAIAFVLLIQYIYEISPGLLANLKKPDIINNAEYMSLTNDAMIQLALISNAPSEPSLYNIYNACATPMGQRLLKHRLLLPVTNTNVMNERYDRVQRCIDGDLWKDLSTTLQGIPDLERLHRKLDLLQLTPANAASLIRAYGKLKDLMTRWPPSDESVANGLDAYMQFLSAIDVVNASGSTSNDDILENVFRYGSRPSIDELTDRIKLNEQCKTAIVVELSNRIMNKQSSSLSDAVVYIKVTDSDFYFTTTPKRYDKLLESIRKDPLVVGINNKVFTFSGDTIVERGKVGSYTGFTSTSVVLLSADQHQAADIIKKTVTAEYKTFLSEWNNTYREFARKVSDYVAEVDVSVSAAKVAVKYKYCRPTVVGDYHRSFVNARQLRHPLVERYSDSYYVPHDIAIGTSDDSVPSAMLMLLCGMNTSGKSTMMRSLVSVVAAQAGLFVPAESFVFSPFDAIYTRILTKDSINRSSFQTEMLELSPMLNRSNERTLVIADELCHSTDFTDAQAIVLASLKHLSQTGACGIFTTHLTEIVDHDILKGIVGSEVYHLETVIEGKTITCKRVLKKGCGPRVYGVEVAAACDLPQSFIEDAYRIRRDIMGEASQYLTFKTSRYNSDVYMDSCAGCGAKVNLESHHIRPQASADDTGFVQHVPIHAAYNIAVLCEACHSKITYNK